MRFKKIYIEITNQCNLKCSFCIQNSRKIQYITTNQFQYILKQIKPYTKYIYLHVLGEPFIHPELEKLLKIAYEMNFHVNLTTNGTLLKKNITIIQKANAIRQINISLHSFPNIPSYLNDVLECSDTLSQHGIYISYRLWTIQNDLSNEMKYTIKAIENHYQIHIQQYQNSIKLKDHLYLSFDSTFEWPSMNHPFISNQGTCHGWRHMCGILVDGSVIPCCLDSKAEAKLGNIYEQTFSTIVSNYSSLLNDFQNHKMTLELCQKCSYRTRFDESE
ncbi:MAG: radical SAM/SPASM domain-containing protein [Traorella sp.]